MQAAKGSGAAEILSWAVAQTLYEGSGWRGCRRLRGGPRGPSRSHLTPRDRAQRVAPFRTTRGPDEFAYVTAVTKEAAPLSNSLLMRHSDELAPARLARSCGGLNCRECLRGPRRRCLVSCPGFARRPGDVTARMMLEPVGLTTGTTRSFRICLRYQLITPTATAPATSTSEPCIGCASLADL
jgi:hypothetical protein